MQAVKLSRFFGGVTVDKTGSLTLSLRLAQVSALRLHWSPIHYGSLRLPCKKITPTLRRGLVPGRGVSHSAAASLRGQLWSPAGAPFTTAPGSTPLQKNDPHLAMGVGTR